MLDTVGRHVQRFSQSQPNQKWLLSQRPVGDKVAGLIFLSFPGQDQEATGVVLLSAVHPAPKADLTLGMRNDSEWLTTRRYCVGRAVKAYI